MKKNKSNNASPIVFSTDPNFRLQQEEVIASTLLPAEQLLRVKLETKHRGGKIVTLITSFVGTIDALEQLGKQMKNLCGTGGSAKDGEIIIQGDHRDKIIQWLHKNGYTKAKKT